MQGCATPNPSADDGNVLIVEDERVSRKALALLLTACGYHTVAAGSGEEALRLLKSDENLNFALVDVDLPGMSGLDLAEKLEERSPGTFTVLITAAEGERIDSFLRDHPVAYLRKPLDFDSLLGLLSNMYAQ
jgi:CheY-like chemotaxis protein